MNKKIIYIYIYSFVYLNAGFSSSRLVDRGNYAPGRRILVGPAPYCRRRSAVVFVACRLDHCLISLLSSLPFVFACNIYVLV